MDGDGMRLRTIVNAGQAHGRRVWHAGVILFLVGCMLMMSGCVSKSPVSSVSARSLSTGHAPDYGHFLSGVEAHVSRVAAEATAGNEQARKQYGNWLNGAGELTRAVELMMPAARRGNAEAQYQVAMALLKMSTPADDVLAAGWLARAAEQQHVRACHELGRLYAAGRGVSRNPELAFSWIGKAAKSGDPLAQNDLGAAYSRGRGTPADAVRAAQWYRRAAEQGYALAQFNLAGAYMSGAGVRRNPGVAYAWYATVYRHAEEALKRPAQQMMKRAFIRAARNGRAEQATALAERYCRQYGGGRK
ncbi:sel1 repeat family protein [Salmonella enterica]|nr:sel1 repeat family protein [Salmonella enterica]